MIDPRPFVQGPMAEAYALLPARMESRAATIQVIATCLQESGLVNRTQFGGGPARGIAQFELGKPGTGAGVTGVFEHAATREALRNVCFRRNVVFSPIAIWNRLATDDVLALALARLGYWANAHPLPSAGDEEGAWRYYLETWHPGEPRPQDWPGNYTAAQGAVPP
jgi:hypothetical protein